jgi:nicotinamidase-related amidase
MTINPRETAVLALHWEVDIVTSEGAFGPFFAEMVNTTGVIARTAHVLSRARSAGMPIIYTRVCFRPGYPDLIVNNPLFGLTAEKMALIDGMPGAEIIPELAPQPGDFVIDHRRVTAFHGTELNTLLKRQGITTLALTGVATNLTVEGTAREASNEGYNVIILADCCSAASPEIHQASLETLGILCSSVTNADEFLKNIIVSPPRI